MGQQASSPGATYEAPALTLSTTNAEGTGKGIRSGATVALFDATVPAALGAAAAGSAAVAARRDHVHPTTGLITVSPAWEWVETLSTASGTTVTSATLPTDSDLFLVIFESVQKSAVGSAELYFRPNSNATADKDTLETFLDNSVPSITQTWNRDRTYVLVGSLGWASRAQRLSGQMLVPRLRGGGVGSTLGYFYFQMGILGGYSAGDDDDMLLTQAGSWGAQSGSIDAITELNFLISAGAFGGGNIYIYKRVV